MMHLLCQKCKVLIISINCSIVRSQIVRYFYTAVKLIDTDAATLFIVWPSVRRMRHSIATKKYLLLHQMKNDSHILVADDNRGVLEALELLLRRHFRQVTLIRNPAVIMSAVADGRPDVVLLDMNFTSAFNNGNEGLYWLERLRATYPQLPVVLMTAFADIPLAIKGIKAGAADFIQKPWDNDRIVEILIAAASKVRKYRDVSCCPVMYWGESDEMSRLKELVGKVAATDATVLITGENGTGKELLAEEIHRLSGIAERPMLKVDMGAVSETLFESELFGHRKGAFTGAVSDRKGKLAEASGSSLFMDEIGNMPLHLQAKLLSALQNRQLTALGSNHPVSFDIRLICATNRNIDAMVADGAFREDLLYRINTIRLHLPPLRQRKDDILVLARRFAAEFGTRYRGCEMSLSDSAANRLVGYHWPGNIRELRHAVEMAVIISGSSDTLSASDFELSTVASVSPEIPKAAMTIEEMERQMISEAIDACKGNLSAAAQQLGITRQTLYNKMRRYAL